MGFPKDREILAVCVIGYFLFSGVLALLDYFVIQASVMCIKLGDDTVFVDVDLPTFSDQLTLKLRSSKKTEEHKSSVGNYFDTDGVLRQEAMFGEIMSLVRKYEATQKKDKNA